MARIKWTKDLASQEALNYQTKALFSAGSFGYERLRRRGLLEQACSHMTGSLQYWDETKASNEALQYTVRKDFMKGSKGAYEYLRTRKLLDKHCQHMANVTRWDRDKVFTLALTYASRNKFQRENAGAYTWLQVNNLRDEALAHMLSHNEQRFKGTKGQTGIYLLKKGDVIVYIGKSLSCISNRLNSHYNDKRGEFDTVEAYLISNVADVSLLEMYLILHHKPALNVDSCTVQVPSITIPNIEHYIDNTIVFKDIK